MIQGKFVSVTDAARELGCTTGRVRQMLITGDIKGEKLTPRAWGIFKYSLDRAAKIPQTTGRPRGSKNNKK